MLNKRITSLLVASIISLSMVGCNNNTNIVEDNNNNNNIEITEEYNNKITQEECYQIVDKYFPNLTEEVKNNELHMFFNEEEQTLFFIKEVDIEYLETFVFVSKNGEEKEETEAFHRRKITPAIRYSEQIDNYIKTDLNADITIIYKYDTPYGCHLAWIEDGEVRQDHVNLEDIQTYLEKEYSR